MIEIIKLINKISFSRVASISRCCHYKVYKVDVRSLHVLAFEWRAYESFAYESFAYESFEFRNFLGRALAGESPRRDLIGRHLLISGNNYENTLIQQKIIESDRLSLSDWKASRTRCLSLEASRTRKMIRAKFCLYSNDGKQSQIWRLADASNWIPFAFEAFWFSSKNWRTTALIEASSAIPMNPINWAS